MKIIKQLLVIVIVMAGLFIDSIEALTFKSKIDVAAIIDVNGAEIKAGDIFYMRSKLPDGYGFFQVNSDKQAPGEDPGWIIFSKNVPNALLGIFQVVEIGLGDKLMDEATRTLYGSKKEKQYESANRLSVKFKSIATGKELRIGKDFWTISALIDNENKNVGNGVNVGNIFYLYPVENGKEYVICNFTGNNAINTPRGVGDYVVRMHGPSYRDRDDNGVWRTRYPACLKENGLPIEFVKIEIK